MKNTPHNWTLTVITVKDSYEILYKSIYSIFNKFVFISAQSEHDPNTQHCLCGADADLIMLGLATHEPNFTIIREEFKPNKPRPCDICGQLGHEMKDCIGAEKDAESDGPQFGSEGEFIFVRLNVLREYLEKDLQMLNLPFKYDFERVVDDWVFMCFFVGNDFLPHLPSLEIREGAIDRLVKLYKETVFKTGVSFIYIFKLNCNNLSGMLINMCEPSQSKCDKNVYDKNIFFYVLIEKNLRI